MFTCSVVPPAVQCASVYLTISFPPRLPRMHVLTLLVLSRSHTDSRWHQLSHSVCLAVTWSHTISRQRTLPLHHTALPSQCLTTDPAPPTVCHKSAHTMHLRPLRLRLYATSLPTPCTSDPCASDCMPQVCPHHASQTPAPATGARRG